MKYSNESYLRSEDLLLDGKYTRPVLKIEAIVEGCPLTRRLKPMSGIGLKFSGRDKILGLGQSNEQLCKAIFRDARPETWVGKTVTLEVRKVRGASGGTQPAIRVMPPNGTPLRSGLARELGDSYEETGSKE